ncbi:MAG: hypothetical protein PHH01_00065 [Patescibacteria group bacterium]|nr:hypothetical protein [Patescibacteria group bacterium]
MKPKPPINETKRDRFKRLAEYRTNEILSKLKILGNCSNQQAYDYTDDDIRKIFDSIEKTTRAVKSKFQLTPKDKDFKL